MFVEDLNSTAVLLSNEEVEAVGAEVEGSELGPVPRKLNDIGGAVVGYSLGQVFRCQWKGLVYTSTLGSVIR